MQKARSKSLSALEAGITEVGLIALDCFQSLLPYIRRLVSALISTPTSLYFNKIPLHV